MKILMIEQHLNSGGSKVWKLKSDKPYVTFGTSRTADLLSIDKELGHWQCVFEFSDEHWKFIDFGADSFKVNTYPTLVLNEEKTITFKNSKLVIKPIQRDVSINNFEILNPSTATSHSYQIYQVYFQEFLLETKILKKGIKFVSDSMPGHPKFECIPSSSWHIAKEGEYVIKQKSIEYEESKKFGKLDISSVIDADSKRGIIALTMLSVAFIAILVSLPKKQMMVSSLSKKATATYVVLKNDAIKKKEIIEKKQQQEVKFEKKEVASKVETTQPTSSGGGTASGKVAGLLKNVNTGRITTLLSKVSSQGQKSKNIILSNGVLAGTAPSGRALAAIGSIDKSGQDWSTEGKSKGFKISTKGLGGGNSISTTGNLKSGKIGQGGVGLIEDESEVVGGLDREEIANYIKTQLGQILYCYERQLSANKDLFGKVSVKFTISGDGKVEAQNVNDTTLKNSQVEGCMLNKIANWKFPTPKGGTKVIVTYPFMFKSTN